MPDVVPLIPGDKSRFEKPENKLVCVGMGLGTGEPIFGDEMPCQIGDGMTSQKHGPELGAGAVEDVNTVAGLTTRGLCDDKRFASSDVG
jgi:hypothetical protein